jgi:hypothetical protein
MSQITDCYMQAELSFAADADLLPGVNPVPAPRNKNQRGQGRIDCRHDNHSTLAPSVSSPFCTQKPTV